MRGALIPVLVAGITPILVLSLILGGLTIWLGRVATTGHMEGTIWDASRR